MQRTPAPWPVAQRGNAPRRLEGDLRGHLRLAEAALTEADRDLDDLEPEREHAPRQLDLERVALRLGAGRVDGAQGACAEALEPAREIAHADTEDAPSIAAAHARDHAPLQAPVLDPAAVHVA